MGKQVWSRVIGSAIIRSRWARWDAAWASAGSRSCATTRSCAPNGRRSTPTPSVSAPSSVPSSTLSTPTHPACRLLTLPVTFRDLLTSNNKDSMRNWWVQIGRGSRAPFSANARTATCTTRRVSIWTICPSSVRSSPMAPGAATTAPQTITACIAAASPRFFSNFFYPENIQIELKWYS